MARPLLALLDSGWDWDSVRVPPLAYAPSQASIWTMVPVVYISKTRPTRYHTVQTCGHASRIKDLQFIALTVAMAGWWQPAMGNPEDNAGVDVRPLHPCLDCHKHVYAKYWRVFNITEHPWAVDLLPLKRHMPLTDSSADSDDSSISSDVIVCQHSPVIELVHEASEDSDCESFPGSFSSNDIVNDATGQDADVDMAFPFQEACNPGQPDGTAAVAHPPTQAQDIVQKA